MNEASDFIIFIGRFHPLVVHLPIGFIILAGVMELLALLKPKKFTGLDAAISISIFSGGVGGAIAALIGYMLSVEGGYDSQTLFWHQWLGILFAVISILCWAIKTSRIRLFSISSNNILVVLIVLISITGHMGANLTHGSTYLTAYAPEIVKTVLGTSKDEVYIEIPENIDSVLVYEHLIKPVLNDKCVRCHNADKSNGNLRLDTKEGILKGGNHGATILAGNALESNLFARTILPKNNVKYMPPNGESLTYSELKLLEWWIQEGGSFDDALMKNKIPEAIRFVLLRDFSIDTKRKPYYETILAPKVAQNTLTELRQSGWSVSHLSNELNILDVEFKQKTLTDTKMEMLKKVKEQITWLDLSKTNLDDAMLKSIGELTNLTRLNLSNTTISDAGISYLQELSHLEVLNLYDTKISDESVKAIEKLSGLKRLYLWRTNITPKGVALLESNIKGIKVIGASNAGKSTI